MAVEEVQHRRKQDVIDGHADRRRGHPGEREAKVVVREQVVGAGRCVEGRPGGKQ